MDDVVEIFVLLHTSYFSQDCFRTSKRATIARVCMVTTVNICKVIVLTTWLNNFLNCAALIKMQNRSLELAYYELQ